MEESKRPANISITFGTMFKAVLVLLLFYFLFLIKDILIMLFISLVFSSAVDPWVDKLQARKIPRAVSISLIYLAIFLLLAFSIYSIIPPIIQEVGDLSQNFPVYLEKLTSSFTSFRVYTSQNSYLDSFINNLDLINTNLQSAAGGIFSTVTGIFGSIFSFFLILVITFYMVVEENSIKKLVWSITPEKHQNYAMQLINRMQRKIGLWLRGQLILSLAIAVLVYPGLLILHVKYALVLALIAGLTEFVPYLGPIIGAIPAVFLAFTQSPMLGLFVAIFYYAVQQVENNILVPKIMQRTVGLNPLVSIFVLLAGFQVWGIAGAILSIPVATAINVFVGDFFASKRGDAAEPEF